MFSAGSRWNYNIICRLCTILLSVFYAKKAQLIEPLVKGTLNVLTSAAKVPSSSMVAVVFPYEPLFFLLLIWGWWDALQQEEKCNCLVIYRFPWMMIPYGL
ncbi:unnamed protein product [Lactuca virosa]|uniref:Uncharacterized protein n=1 Tax=Lactuca virosa TaxID=75947 RepID=A0AAU9PGA5_9ASTR|nr:unnamed protein product [Lactuca virosa]